MAIWPVDLDQWNREGRRLPRQRRYVMKLTDDNCSANSLRMRQSSLGPSIVRIMYYNRFVSIEACYIRVIHLHV